MTGAITTVTNFWTACGARDWATFAELIAPDVVYEVPQTRERIRGRDTYVEFNATFPGDWTIDIVRITGADRQAASWINFRLDNTEQSGLCFFELDDAGLISRISDFWPDPYEPPPGREHLTERY